MTAESTNKASEAKDSSATAAKATGTAAAATVDPKEKYLQLLTSSLVLVRDAVETQDQRYMLRMLRRFKQLRLQQQEHPRQLLQVCSLLFWGQQHQLQGDASSNSSAYGNPIHLNQKTLEFWQKLRETLEMIVNERQGEGEMEADGVTLNS